LVVVVVVEVFGYRFLCFAGLILKEEEEEEE
jgi:hypothetical protein